MIIKSLYIIDFVNKEACSYDFSNTVNLIVSNGNKIGKSSLLKSIYYALGFDIKQFPSGWNIKNKIFQLKIQLNNGIIHTITRQSDIYKVDSKESPLNSKEYSKWLQDILDIDMKLPHKTTKKLHSVYSTALLLPFYIDQDDSWEGVLYRRASDTLGQYNDVPKGIFEYSFSISDTSVQQYQNQINQYSEYIKNISSTINSLLKVLDNYKNKTSQIPKVQEIDRNKLAQEIKQYLSYTNEYRELVSSFKSKLARKKQELDLKKQDFDELNHLLRMNENRYKYIETECKYCHSKLTEEQSLTRLGLNNNKFEIIILKNEVVKTIEKLEEEIKIIQSEQLDIEKKIVDLNNRIKKSKELLTIDEYINARAISAAVSEIENTVEKEKKTKLDYELTKKQLQKDKRELEKQKKELINKIQTKFNFINNKIRTTLGITDSELKFLEFKKIDGSGMDKNIKYLEYYLSYFHLLDEFSIYKIPFCMDSFIKNEISKDTAKPAFSAIEKYFLTLDNNQIFFSIVTDNIQFLENTEKYNIIHIEDHLLCSDKYDIISSQIL